MEKQEMDMIVSEPPWLELLWLSVPGCSALQAPVSASWGQVSEVSVMSGAAHVMTLQFSWWRFGAGRLIILAAECNFVQRVDESFDLGYVSYHRATCPTFQW